MSDWRTYDVFHLPPPDVALTVEVEVTCVYDGGQVDRVRQILPAYYDRWTNKFRWRGVFASLPGPVLRWRVVEQVDVNRGERDAARQ